MGNTKKVGIWLYQNGGGDVIQQKLRQQLQDRDIDTVTGLNLRHAVAKEGNIICQNHCSEEDEVKVNTLDLFFSYNAGEQTQYQMYLFKALSRLIPTVNDFDAFELTEDKFHTSILLQNHGIVTPQYHLCHRDDSHHLTQVMQKWDKMVYKPTDGWGGMGLTKIENEASLDMLMPFLNQMDIRHFYVEKFIDYDNTDYRIDIVDGQFVGCYGRKAGNKEWRTNISSGGSVFLREPNDEVVDLALKATKITGLDIAGVDIVYDRQKEEYVVLEVNGIPAFATPQQEKLGLDFNDKKIELIANLIDRKTKKKER